MVKFRNEISGKKNALNKLEDNFKKTIWSKTETVRKSYSKTQSGYTSSRQRFIERLLTITPSAVDENVLKNLYNVAYGSEDVRYKELQLVSTMSIPSSPLLKKHIVSSSHTDFADFLKALNAIPWVSQGHRDYQHIAGDKCPYCQQKLPNTFENDLASCFDEQYKKEVKQLQDFIQAYKTAMNNFYSVMNNNTKNNFACAELADYSTNFDLFMEKSKANVYLLNKKK